MTGKNEKNNSSSVYKSSAGKKKKKSGIIKVFSSSGKKDQKSLFNTGLVKLLAAAFAVGCFVIIVGTSRDCSEKQKEIDLLDEKIHECELQNADLQRILDNDDLSAYIEQKAIEERGYAYPDEYRFYDASRD